MHKWDKFFKKLLTKPDRICIMNKRFEEKLLMDD